jgi:hypothetical protein
MGWKTITGTGMAVLGYLLQPEVLAVLPEKWASVVMALGILLGVVGGRHAIAKLQTQVR